MTKFMNPSFNSPANSEKFRENYDKVFGQEKVAPSNKETGDIKEPEEEEEEGEVELVVCKNEEEFDNDDDEEEPEKPETD